MSPTSFGRLVLSVALLAGCPRQERPPSELPRPGEADASPPAAPSKPADGPRVGLPESPRTGAPPTEEDRVALQAEVARARSVLSERLGVAESDIRLLRAERVEWPDSSLGCPEAGYQYMQVITSGVRILFSAGGRTHAFHGPAGGPATLCERPQKALPRSRSPRGSGQ